MKILRVIPTINPDTGGPLEGLKRASLIMSELGIDVEVASLDTPGSFSEESDALPWPSHKHGSIKLMNYGYSNRFKNWIDKHAADYDAVIIHCMWQYHGYATSRACRKAGVPYFIYPHGMLDPWFNEAYPLKKIKKQIYWRLAEHSVLHHARAVLFTSEEECQLARQSFHPYRVQEQIPGYGTTKPDVIPSEAAATLRQSEHEWAKQPYFLFLGRIQEKKGLDLLIEAYAALRTQTPDMPNLVIAGPEQQPQYAEDLRSRFSQEGIHWVGVVTGDLKWQTIAAAEALTLVSHQENFGLVVAEALSLGTPVLISNKVNIWREIADNNAGIVSQDTLAGAKELISKWLESSQPQRESMRLAASQTFQKHFDIRASTERLIALIHSYLTTKNNASQNLHRRSDL
ncbi:glycosyltransferase [Coraliomargarita sp. W4R53]